MAKNAVRGSSMERKIISVSGKRQITIPQKYFEMLGFSNEAECILQNNAIVIRPIRENTGNEFSEQILADLIAQGFLGQELLEKFKEVSKKITPAMDKLIGEADRIAKGDPKSAAMSDIFGAEDIQMYVIRFTGAAEKYLKKIKEKGLKKAFQEALKKKQ